MRHNVGLSSEGNLDAAGGAVRLAPPTRGHLLGAIDRDPRTTAQRFIHGERSPPPDPIAITYRDREVTIDRDGHIDSRDQATGRPVRDGPEIGHSSRCCAAQHGTGPRLGLIRTPRAGSRGGTPGSRASGCSGDSGHCRNETGSAQVLVPTVLRGNALFDAPRRPVSEPCGRRASRTAFPRGAWERVTALSPGSLRQCPILPGTKCRRSAAEDWTGWTGSTGCHVARRNMARVRRWV